MCGERRETLEHIICECKKLAQRGYKRRHDTAHGTFVLLETVRET